MTKIFIIAAEASGDNLGAKLITQLKKTHKNAHIKIIGGVNMQKQGHKSLFDIKTLSVMGLMEVLPKLFQIIKLINQAVAAIIKFQPDILITIDSPDFSFRVAKKVKKIDINNKIKKIHLIAPSVWAWREKRAEKIAKIYDQLLCILPFEPPYFTKYGLKTDFVGHPILENYMGLTKKTDDFLIENNLPSDQKIILITPGSRVGEVGRMLPIFIEAFNILSAKFSDIMPAILTTKNTKDIIENHATDFAKKPLLVNGDNQDQKIKLMQSSFLAMAKSGTNAIELSFFEIPLIIAYKVNFLSAFLFRLVSNLKYGNLINILLNKEIIPELIQENCQANLIANELESLLTNPAKRKNQIKQCQIASKMMLPSNHITPTADIVKKIYL